MRLIDADAITKSKELAKKVKSCSLTPYIAVDDLLEFIDNLPTAYDVEKVLAELDEQATDTDVFGKLLYLQDAIDIVKRGGVE